VIEKIYSDLPSFTDINLHSGLNILLADTTDESTKKDTRNGLGKTTFIEIINFLLGGKCASTSVFKLNEFINYYFCMDLSIQNSKISVKRRGKNHNKVNITCEQDSKVFLLLGKTEAEITLTEWNNYLGKLLFNLDEDTNSINYRSIFPYFIRKSSSGGFLDAEKYHNHQKILDTQIYLTYLLGLEYELAIEQKLLEKKKSEIKSYKSVLDTELYKEINTGGTNLASEVTILTEKANTMMNELEKFQVHPQYKVIEIEATQLTKKISKISNENFLDRQILENLLESAIDNEETSKIDIQDLYNEVQVKLPDAIVKSYEESKIFHDVLIQNRKKYLDSEIEKYKKNISMRENEIEGFSMEQSKLMEILSTYGALEQFTNLQSRLNDLVTKIDYYKKQSKILSDIQTKQAELTIEEQKLIIEVNKSLSGHEAIKSKAILLVEETSKVLYETAAHLIIGQADNGRYDIKINSRNQKSSGINSMLIFCFDMMLVQMQKYLGRNQDFLIHDSSLYDPVDERQIEEALKFAKNQANESDFQYIITMNSDDLPEGIKDEISENILEKILTDSDESGSLMGIFY
jgi:uncharacterized protein YydD (DUF2326 family)